MDKECPCEMWLSKLCFSKRMVYKWVQNQDVGTSISAANTLTDNHIKKQQYQETVWKFLLLICSGFLFVNGPRPLTCHSLFQRMLLMLFLAAVLCHIRSF